MEIFSVFLQCKPLLQSCSGSMVALKASSEMQSFNYNQLSVILFRWFLEIQHNSRCKNMISHSFFFSFLMFSTCILVLLKNCFWENYVNIYVESRKNEWILLLLWKLLDVSSTLILEVFAGRESPTPFSQVCCMSYTAAYQIRINFR